MRYCSVWFLKCQIRPSIHPSSSTYLGPGRRGKPPSPQPSPPSCLGEYQGVARPAKSYNLPSMSWVCPRASSRWDMPKTPDPGGILARCPNRLNCLLWRSSGAILSPCWMAELLTLSLRERPATLQRKFISAASFFRSLPTAHDHRVRVGTWIER